MDMLSDQPTVSTADIETAVIEAMDAIASEGGMVVGYEDHEISPVDVSGLVLDALERIQRANK